MSGGKLTGTAVEAGTPAGTGSTSLAGSYGMSVGPYARVAGSYGMAVSYGMAACASGTAAGSYGMSAVVPEASDDKDGTR